MDVRARRAPNWQLFFKNPQPTSVTELRATLRAGIAPARSLPQPRQASKHANNQLEQLARTGTEAEIQGKPRAKGRQRRRYTGLQYHFSQRTTNRRLLFRKCSELEVTALVKKTIKRYYKASN